MMRPLCALTALAAALVSDVAAVAPTDSYTDADVMQSGYLPNHNMDPAVVDSAQFGLLWKQTFNAKEQVGDASSLFPLRIDVWWASRLIRVPCSFTPNHSPIRHWLEGPRFFFWLPARTISTP